MSIIYTKYASKHPGGYTLPHTDELRFCDDIKQYNLYPFVSRKIPYSYATHLVWCGYGGLTL